MIDSFELLFVEGTNVFYVPEISDAHQGFRVFVLVVVGRPPMPPAVTLLLLLIAIGLIRGGGTSRTVVANVVES